MQHIRSCGLRMCLFILFCTFFLFFFTPWLWNSNYIHIILLKSWHEDRYTAFCFPSKVILTLYCLVFKHSCVVLSMIDWFVLFWGRGFQCEIAVLSDAQVQSNASLRRLQFLWATNRAKWLRSDVIVVPNDIVFVSLLTSHLIINMISTVWRESRLFFFFVFFGPMDKLGIELGISMLSGYMATGNRIYLQRNVCCLLTKDCCISV